MNNLFDDTIPKKTKLSKKKFILDFQKIKLRIKRCLMKNNAKTKYFYQFLVKHWLHNM